MVKQIVSSNNTKSIDKNPIISIHSLFNFLNIFNNPNYNPNYTLIYNFNGINGNNNPTISIYNPITNSSKNLNPNTIYVNPQNSNNLTSINSQDLNQINLTINLPGITSESNNYTSICNVTYGSDSQYSESDFFTVTNTSSTGKIILIISSQLYSYLYNNF